MTALVIAEAVAIVFLAILVVGLLRSHADVLRELHELREGQGSDAPFRTAAGVAEPRMTGTRAHDIAGATPDGGVAGIRVTQTGQPTLVAFMSTTCSTCEHFWEGFQSDEVLATLGNTRLVIVTRSPQDELAAEVARLAPDGMPLVMSSAAWDNYQVPGSPYFVMVDGASGVITGEGSASSWDKLLDLMGIADGDGPVDAGSNDRDRAERIDQELADSGILPGDPQLYSLDDPLPGAHQ